LLPKDKVTPEVAELRNVSIGQDIHSPAYHQDIKNVDDLKAKIAWLRKLSDGVPITVKMAAGHVAKDVELAVMADPDIIAIDGMEGGTGAAPEIMLNEVGLPALAALTIARRTLDRLGARQELWIGGGFSEGSEAAKALALGANGVFFGFSLLVAMGCAFCQQCYSGKCPRGITTQEPELKDKLDIGAAALNVSNFINNCTEEIKMAAGACGKDYVHDLGPDDLRALTADAARIADVPFVADAKI
jgi:glutamate synthase domain-containing protein 2